jgi:hypothetical protein
VRSHSPSLILQVNAVCISSHHLVSSVNNAEIALFWRRSWGAGTKDKPEGERKFLYWADYSTEAASEADALSGLTESEKSIYEIIVNIKNE